LRGTPPKRGRIITIPFSFEYRRKSKAHGPYQSGSPVIASPPRHLRAGNAKGDALRWKRNDFPDPEHLDDTIARSQMATHQNAGVNRLSQAAMYLKTIEGKKRVS
jgi:hypothetical protein